jgi:hypothetical protein
MPGKAQCRTPAFVLKRVKSEKHLCLEARRSGSLVTAELRYEEAHIGRDNNDANSSQDSKLAGCTRGLQQRVHTAFTQREALRDSSCRQSR